MLFGCIFGNIKAGEMTMQNTIETTTWHDMRPTHADPLADLRFNMNDAWEAFDRVIDMYYDGIVTDRQIVDTAKNYAIAAQQAYDIAWAKLNQAEQLHDARHIMSEEGLP